MENYNGKMAAVTKDDFNKLKDDLVTLLDNRFGKRLAELEDNLSTAQRQTESVDNRLGTHARRLENLERETKMKNAWFWHFPVDKYPLTIRMLNSERTATVKRFMAEILQISALDLEKISIDRIWFVIKNDTNLADVKVVFHVIRQ